ncbi:hypothetical protein SUGI_0058110 [Cryptomeria japonica]|nr:hypothetical protein SUGI_0058110 [Cryptomeria japonica]
METQRGLSCEGCGKYITTSAICGCQEAFILTRRNEEQQTYLDLYRQQFLHLIKYLIQIGVPNPSQLTQHMSCDNLERNAYNKFARDEPRRICDMFYAKNGVQIELNTRFEKYRDRVVDLESSNMKSNLHSETSKSNQNSPETFCNGESENEEKQDPTLHVRLVQDWNRVFPYSRVEIVGEGLEWQWIEQEMDRNGLHLAWHFYSWMWSPVLRCFKCDKFVNIASGDCDCYETAIVNKQDGKLMGFYKNQFLHLVKTCIKENVPNPSQMREDTPCEWRTENEVFAYMNFSVNGVFICTNNCFSNYASVISGNWRQNENDLRDSSEGEKGKRNHENNVVSIDHTLHLRLRCFLNKCSQSELEIIGQDIEWQGIVEAVESDSANLVWHFYSLDSPPNNQRFQVEDNDEGGDYVDDQQFERYANQLFEAENSLPRAPPPAALSAVENLAAVEMEGSSDALCCICQNIMTEGESMNRLPCEHMFHRVCIVKWLRVGNFCPVCKYELPIDDGTHK